jgi:hypothetical protein
VNEDLDWGPKRPAAVSWAGVLLFLVGLVQLLLLVGALVMGAAEILIDAAWAAVVVWELVFALLEIVTAVGVIRLGRGWRVFGVALAGVGAVLQSLKIVGAEGDPILIGWSGTFTAIYVVIFVLLMRSGEAFD